MTLPMLKGEQPRPAATGRTAGPAAKPGEAAPPRLRLAFVTSADPLNVRTWSGTPYHMLEALRRHADVVEIVREPWSSWFEKPRRAVRRLTRWRIDLTWSRWWSKLASRNAVERLAACDCDAVVAVAVSSIVIHLAPRKPTVFVSDATFFAMSDYNHYFQQLSPALRKSADALEHDAINKSLIASFPSRWAHSSAVEDYGGDPARTLQIPWGANLEAGEITPPGQRPASPWRLLFVGVDWEGKGGDILLETVRILRERGQPVELDIVGCAPSDPPPAIDGVTFHGFISKNTPDGQARLRELFRAAHLFVLPTQFDAFPTVIAESASFGLPAVSYRTGGLTTNVIDGETGILLDEGAPAQAFADAIEGLMSDPARYRAMAEAALRFSRETLNWDSWAKTLVDAIRETLAERKGGHAVAG
jgi:glycosyltransferase involved in cell wall biosynthesis